MGLELAVYGRFGSIDSTKTGRFDAPKAGTWGLPYLATSGRLSRSCQNWQPPRLLGCCHFWQLCQEVAKNGNFQAAYKLPELGPIHSSHTSIQLVPTDAWTMAAEGSKRVEIAGLGDKRQVTATFAAALDGTFLPMQILYQGKTKRSHPKYAFPDGFDILHTPNHWASEETCIRFFNNNIIFPYIEHVRETTNSPSQKAYGHDGQLQWPNNTLSAGEGGGAGVIAVMVPAGMTNRLQPLDVSTNKAAKDFLQEKFRQWYTMEVE